MKVNFVIFKKSIQNSKAVFLSWQLLMFSTFNQNLFRVTFGFEKVEFVDKNTALLSHTQIFNSKNVKIDNLKIADSRESPFRWCCMAL